MILQNLVLGFIGPQFKGVPYYWKGTLNLLGMQLSVERVFFIVATVGAGIAYYYFLQKTKLGKAIRGVADNVEAAQASGINIDHIYAISFGVSAMLAGMAGALLLPLTTAYPTCGVAPLYSAFVVIIIGGIRNVMAPIIGGFAMGIIETLAVSYLGFGWDRVISMAIVTLALIIKPHRIEEERA